MARLERAEPQHCAWNLRPRRLRNGSIVKPKKDSKDEKSWNKVRSEEGKIEIRRDGEIKTVRESKGRQTEAKRKRKKAVAEANSSWI
jgi:hypothetical protein